MRTFVLATVIVLGCVSGAAGQGTRVAFGPVTRLDSVSIEGGAGGVTAVAGLHTTVRISRIFGVEAEVTGAKNRIDRSYEGWFISYATDPHASREEIERLAPTARRSLGWAPGAGWSVAATARGSMTPRVSLAVKAGVSARRYLETSSFTILSIPDGLDPARVERDFQNFTTAQRRTRGGLLLGMDVAVALTSHIIVGPEIRFVYGGPARVGNTHRELGLGLRGAWRF
jgi:hypothetical protein